MARNIFAEGMNAFDQAYDRTQAIGDQVQRRRAGAKLATGDRQGAAATFAERGMIDEARQMQRDDLMMQDREAAMAADEQQAQFAAAKERADVLTKVAGGLKTVPAGQRMQALAQVYPLFQKIGLDTAIFDQLSEDQLTDQALDLFTGEVRQQVEQFTLSPGAKRFDTTGKLIAEAPFAPEKPISVREGTTLLDPNTRQPIYSKPKTYAPQRPSGSSSAGLPPPPAGWTPAR